MVQEEVSKKRKLPLQCNYKQNNEVNCLTNIVKPTNKGMLKGTKHC